MTDNRKVFKIFQGKNGKYYWHLVNEFGIIYAHGGNLDAEITAIAACESVQRNAPMAAIEIARKKRK